MQDPGRASGSGFGFELSHRALRFFYNSDFPLRSLPEQMRGNKKVLVVKIGGHGGKTGCIIVLVNLLYFPHRPPYF
jgi:hypothetical protein